MAKIVLIACGKKKLGERAEARDLYASPLFKMNFKFAESLKPQKIFVLSAKHGLVGLNQKLAPYNQTLNTMSVGEIKKWAERVRNQMKGKINFERDEIIFLAGMKYRKFLIPYFHKTNAPLKGLGIGKQLKFLKNKIKK